MLEILKKIVLKVSKADTVEEAVTIIVQGVKDTLSVDVCSIYLEEKDGYVLSATHGLSPDNVGQIWLGKDKGLIGMVARLQEPINIDDAPTHPEFKYFPESGEEQFHGFLGVPIMHHGKSLGVMTVQQRSRRRFNDDEVAFLITIAAQIAGTIHHTVLTGAIKTSLIKEKSGNAMVQGLKGSPGITVGTIIVVKSAIDLDSVVFTETEDVETEISAFNAAVEAIKQGLKKSAERANEFLQEQELALFDVYIMLLTGEGLVTDVLNHISSGLSASAALRETIMEHVAAFEQMEDPYLRARSEDMRYLGRRIMEEIHAANPVNSGDYPSRCVLLGADIGLTDIVEVPRDRLMGIVCTGGSDISHTAILARALGIPAVMGLADLPISQLDGHMIAIDGFSGRICLNPSPTVLSEFQRLQKEEQALSDQLNELVDLPAITPDGTRVMLYANTGLVGANLPYKKSGADGAGLYRTEFPFLEHQSFPSEEVQFQIYREVLNSSSPQLVFMRTLDVGGDKMLPYLPIDDPNPFLGWRGIRITLDHPEIFIIQLRAMLRAHTEFRNMKILFPMISRLSELDASLSILQRAYQQLVDEGHHPIMPETGVMIEVPSAIYMIKSFAQRVDFLEIGTNDLTQYLLAVDRNNARVAHLYDSLHPSVLHALVHIVEAAHTEKINVGICGEMASDPAAILLLVAIGVDSLSMTPYAVPRAKWVIRSVTKSRMSELLDQVLTMEGPSEIRKLLNNVLEEYGLASLVHADEK